MRVGPTLLLLAMVTLMGASTPVLSQPADDARLACPDKSVRIESQGRTAKNCRSAGSERDLQECLAQTRIQSEVSLRKALNVLLVRLKPADRERFKQTHTAWCAYRDAACEFDAPPDALGSMMPRLRQQCRAARNKAQEKAVVTLSECLADGDCERPPLFFVYQVGAGVD